MELFRFTPLMLIRPSIARSLAHYDFRLFPVSQESNEIILLYNLSPNWQITGFSFWTRMAKAILEGYCGDYPVKRLVPKIKRFEDFQKMSSCERFRRFLVAKDHQQFLTVKNKMRLCDSICKWKKQIFEIALGLDLSHKVQ